VANTKVAASQGTAEATCGLGLFATGDASIQKAAENGGLKTIHHVDCEILSILGLYLKFTTIAYGE